MKVISIYELLGLIKDGKAPEIINIRGNEFKSFSCSTIESYYRDYDGTNWLECIDIKLEDEVEIIEDEFIDIEELELVSLEEFKRMNSAERYHITAIEYDKINDLIKSQKKIIERLDKNE